MSSIIIAAILIAVVVIICMVLVTINNKHKKKMINGLVDHFNKTEQENNLTVSDRELLGNLVIGLDKVRRKVVVVKKEDDTCDSLVIDLREIRSCSVKKIYKSVNMGTQKKERFENLVDKIVLEFEYTDKKEMLEVPFFESASNHLLEMSELEQFARDWEIIVSKSMTNKLKKTA
jgi:hypothetical protein